MKSDPEFSSKSSGAKASRYSREVTARLKSCPFATSPIRWHVVLLSAQPSAHAASGDAPRSFSLSTTRTFAPGDSVKIQLLARNVPELEFRVYKVRDAEQFFAGLKDAHSFGVKNYSPSRTDRPGDLAGADSRFQGASLVADPELFPRTIY